MERSSKSAAESRAFTMRGDAVPMREALRETFREYIRRYVEADNDDRELPAAVQRCAREAQRDGIMPEHMVIYIDNTWREARPSTGADDGTELRLLHLIGLALDAYFRDD